MEVHLSNIIRSMRREGYSTSEIYDVLTGAGLPWQEVHLLIERVELELQEMKFESRPDQLRRLLDEALANLRDEISARLETIERKLAKHRRK
ncbi:MAG: hypothetical protein ACK4GQ_03425 [Candidatus Hadarchaeales archaeon]